MVDTKWKIIFSALALSLAFGPLKVHALRSCYQGQLTVVDGATHRKMAGYMWLTWNQGRKNIIPVLRVKGRGFDIQRDLSCDRQPPYGCVIDQDGGQLNLTFSGDGLTVQPHGQLQLLRDDGGRYRWLVAKEGAHPADLVNLVEGRSPYCPRLDSIDIGDPPSYDDP